MALIDKASLLMVPSTYEAGTLYNVLPSGNRAPDSTDQNSGYDQTRADFTFDRGSNAAATRIGSDGLIKKYRENLLVQSNQFDTTWQKISVSVTSGQTGYDGSSDAWLLNKNSGGNGVYLNQNVSVSGVNTFSVYAKAGTLNNVAIFCNGSFGGKYFDLTNGTIGGNLFGAPTHASIEDVGNGWYRCSIVLDDGASDARVYPANNGSLTDAGNIYIQSAQLESGMVSTDYLDSGATTAKAGVLIDLPRINYDANGENGALLLEPSRANLIPHSEYIEDGAWTKSNATITTNHATSPEGVQNASLVTFASGGYILDSVTTTKTIGSTETISVFSNADISGTFLKYGGGTAAGTDVEGREVIGNGWYRYYVTRTFTEAETASTQLLIAQSNVGDSVLIYGAQLEAGYLTSYIPNYGTSGGVTRAADVNTLSNAISLDGDFALFWEGAVFEDDIMLYGSGTTAWYMNYNTSNGRIILDELSGRKVEAYLGSGTPTGVKTKILIKRVSGVHSVFANGTKLTNTTSVNSTNTLSLSSMFWGYSSSFYKGLSVNQSFVSKTELNDAECVTLTTL